MDSPHAQAVKVELPLGRTTLTAENGEYSGESAMGGGHNTTTSDSGIPPFPFGEFFGAYIKPPDDALRRATLGTTQRGGRSPLMCGYAHSDLLGVRYIIYLSFEFLCSPNYSQTSPDHSRGSFNHKHDAASG